MVKVSVIDDQTTPMDFVALVLESIFGHPPHEAVRITLLTDSDGEAVCGLCEDRVEAQVLVSAAVQMSRQRGYPLQFSNNLVFDRLAPGLLRDLQSKSPKNEKGYRPNRLHQWFTEDVGDPMLAQHLHSLIMFQRLAIANGYGWQRFLHWSIRYSRDAEIRCNCRWSSQEWKMRPPTEAALPH